MALKFLDKPQTTFFTKVFGPLHEVTEKAKALMAAGVTFEVTLYTLVATVKMNQNVLPLTTSTTALMTGTADATIAVANATLIENWIKGLHQETMGTPLVMDPTITVLGIKPGDPQPNLLVAIKAIKAVTGLGLYDAKTLAEQLIKIGFDADLTIKGVELAEAYAMLSAAGLSTSLKAVSPGTPYPTPPPSHSFINEFAAQNQPKPINAVIHLKDALALGQKVHGTSNGSVYYTVALTADLKVAARLYQGGSIAIRAEWQGEPKADLEKLAAAGVNMKGGYASIHFDSAGVPVQRTVGAFLLGTGINWTAMVHNGADLVITEAGKY